MTPSGTILERGKDQCVRTLSGIPNALNDQ